MTHAAGEAAPQDSGTVVTFYSFKGGTGRTMALANVAWILASNGKRVLAMDWDLEAPGLHRYFAPFLRDPELNSTSGVIDLVRGFELLTPRPAEGFRAHARVDRFSQSLDCDFPGGGFIEFVSSGRRTPEYSETINTYDWRGFYERRDGKAFLHALREDMLANYDYALIDSRTGFSDTSGITTLLLPDVLVNCFTLNVQSVDGGANVARDVRRSAPHVRILPVPMRVDADEQERLNTARNHARARFQEFLEDPARPDADRYWGDVEIPYRPYYAYEEALAALVDPRHIQGTLLTAYERLTSVITGGEVTALGQVAEEQRAQQARRFDRAHLPGAAAPRVRLDYALRDRLWAEWIANQLKASGATVSLRPSSPSTTTPIHPSPADIVIALLSPDFAGTTLAAEVRTIATATDQRIVGLRTREYAADTVLGQLPGFTLAGMPAGQAAERVCALVGVDTPVGPVGGGPRYPGEAPAIFTVPPRYNLFTGRDVQLERLWDELGLDSLDPGTPAGRVFLYGLGGIGKTQIAQEYVHRFGAQYDLVHWISADQLDLVPQSLADLGSRLGVPGEAADDRATATLTALQNGRHGRWLLVYDNAENADTVREGGRTLEDYLPTMGPGHVIITARHSRQSPGLTSVEVDAFSRPESVALLRRRIDGLSREDADRIAEELGDLPMAVEQASAWLRETTMPVDTYLEQVRSRVSQVLTSEGGAQDAQTSLPAVWRLSVDRLRAERPAAVRLLELCSFFSPEPIADSLLYSDGMRNQLAESDPALRDPMIMGYLIRDLGRYALARMGKDSLQVHRLLQAAIREWIAEEPGALERTRHQAHLVLASALPSPAQGEDSAASLKRFAELRPHLEPSEAIGNLDPQVGEWVVSQVRNLWKINDHRAAIGLGRRALRRWTEIRGADDPLTLRLAAQLANPLRSLGRFAEAYELDESTLRRQRAHPQLGPDHPHTLITARNYGADLNGLGRYTEASESDTDTLARYRRTVGSDHQDTLRAINNLGVSLNLIGRPRDALALAEEAYRTARQNLGLRSGMTWAFAQGAALDRRENGDYDGALELLLEARNHLVELFGEQSPQVMRTDASLSVTRRRLGEHRAAEALSRTTYDQFRRRYGDNHPETLACAANLCCDLLALGADDPALYEKAREIGERNHGTYRSVLGEEHPFTLAAATNLIIVRRMHDEPLAALDLGTATLRALTERVGPGHPAAVACRGNLAGVLVQLERYEEALTEDERTLGHYRELFDDRHPRVLCGEYNVAVDRLLLGHAGADGQIREIGRRATARFGDKHPTSKAMTERRRIDFEVEMPPI
jgi:hypothetical protein